MVVNSDANDIQNDIFLTLLPLTVDCRAFIELGST